MKGATVADAHVIEGKGETTLQMAAHPTLMAVTETGNQNEKGEEMRSDQQTDVVRNRITKMIVVMTLLTLVTIVTMIIHLAMMIMRLILICIGQVVGVGVDTGSAKQLG